MSDEKSVFKVDYEVNLVDGVFMSENPSATLFDVLVLSDEGFFFKGEQITDIGEANRIFFEVITGMHRE